ncbi:hypothetical protein O6H91_Y157300 [Diphasiastrum complanatum]|nr:hypothetical protein O6H91_Y157300 [Diphasiastrum complanatum]KAJ7295882.1 hypothetical protein O6H91_Y157300 [Diphasiastrum complanatum]KAJ7295883.1 hypothetical protein O6H91_Y157300 [Diphasiastrum complanatum]KAJ7295884.1 hypothetical protein O6H91_Y157300 [Diphasiastrum complanatum]
MVPTEASGFIKKHNKNAPNLDELVGYAASRFVSGGNPVDSLVITRRHAGKTPFISTSNPCTTVVSDQVHCSHAADTLELGAKQASMFMNTTSHIVLPSPMARRMHLQPPRTPTSPSISPNFGPWHGRCGVLDASPSTSSSSASHEFDDAYPCTPGGLLHKNSGFALQSGENVSHSPGGTTLQEKVHKEAGYPFFRRNTYPTSLVSVPYEEHVGSLWGKSRGSLSQPSPPSKSSMMRKDESSQEEALIDWDVSNCLQGARFAHGGRFIHDDIAVPADHGMPLLAKAICAQLPDKVAALLQSGCSWNGENGSVKGTPLILAATSGNEKITKLLLAAGANINFHDSRQYTALHHAAIGGHRSVVKLLLVAGADIHARTSENFLPIQLTTDPNIRRLLKLHMGDEEPDELGMSKMPIRDQSVVPMVEDSNMWLRKDQNTASHVTDSYTSNSAVQETIFNAELKDDQGTQNMTDVQTHGDSEQFDLPKFNATNSKNLQIPGSQPGKSVQDHMNLSSHTETPEKPAFLPRSAMRSESKVKVNEKKTVKFVALECTEEDLALVRKDWHDAARAGCCGCGKEGCGGKCLPQRQSPKSGKGHYDGSIYSEQAVHPEVKAGSFQWTRGELLGEGAYGKVFAGLNQITGELMAVKQLKTEPTDGQEKSFHLASLEREISLYKKMRHKHIVGYVHMEKDEASGSLYIFLEYVSGGSIQSMLERFGRFSEPLVKVYTRQLLLGLEYLHKNKVVHRDIKGGNVLVDAAGVVKLADFGASKAFHDPMMTDGCRSIRGSVFWMAPEVIKGDGYGRRADIWSVGCTVIEMLTATHPWPGIDNTWTAIFHIAKASSGPPIPDVASGCVKDFLQQCFQLDPKERPTATELLQHEFVINESDLTEHDDTSNA